jgi:hypothetical protein
MRAGGYKLNFVQDKEECRALLNTRIELKKTASSPTNWVPIGFSRSIMSTAETANTEVISIISNPEFITLI